jgi:hypothetical protein
MKYISLILFSLACYLFDRWMQQHYGDCTYQDGEE